MAAAILTEDFLFICLIFSKGDINMRLEEVICRAEAYQKASDRHFGISRSDFRNAIYMLSFITYHETGLGNYEEILAKNPLLKDWIVPILRYEDIYFNDEGEHWCEYKGTSQSPTNIKMRKFFSDVCNHKKENVLKYLNKVGKNRTTLLKCSFPGKSH